MIPKICNSGNASCHIAWKRSTISIADSISSSIWNWVRVFYHNQLGDVVRDLEKRGLAVDSDGATCVFLEGFEAPMIVRRKMVHSSIPQPISPPRNIESENSNPMQSSTWSIIVKANTLISYLPSSEKWESTASSGTISLLEQFLARMENPSRHVSGSVIGLEYLLDEAIAKAWGVVKGPAEEASSVSMSTTR